MTETAPAFLDRKLIEQARIYTRVEADAGRYSNIDDNRAKYVAAGNDRVVAAIDQELAAIETEEKQPWRTDAWVYLMVGGAAVLCGAIYFFSRGYHAYFSPFSG